MLQAEENLVVLRGHLVKENWYGREQKRFFELYSYGELKYYEGSIVKNEGYDYKGSITVNKDSSVLKQVVKGPLDIHCQARNKVFNLLQCDSTKINFANEKKMGYTFLINDWVTAINSVIEYLKY